MRPIPENTCTDLRPATRGERFAGPSGAPPPPDRVPSFTVGPVPVYGDKILSPMEGYADLPFRAMCRELGSAMSYTAFINALEVSQNPARVTQKLAFLPHERPVVFQIFYSEPARLLEVALRLQELGPDIMDINLGCSAKSVARRGAGAGLLRTPPQSRPNLSPHEPGPRSPTDR